MSYTQNDTDLNGGGTLDTNIWTNHVDLGLAYKFQGAAACTARSAAPFHPPGGHIWRQ